MLATILVVLPYCRDMIEVHAISSPCEVVRLTHLAWLTLLLRAQ